MRLDTLKGRVRAMFDPEAVTASAKDHGLVLRGDGKVQPFDLLLSLLAALCVGPRRDIATVRRAWERLTGETISRGAFDAHFDKPALVAWTWDLLRTALAATNRRRRRDWPPALRTLRDVLITDGTTLAVRAALAETLRSTSPGLAAIKLLATVALGTGTVVEVRLGAAVHHDRRLLRDRTVVPGALYLRDLGFYDHREFARLEDGGSRFVSRLKDSAVPTIVAITCGVAAASLGARLDDFVAYGAAVDVDARFHVTGAPPRIFRVVKLDVPITDRHDRPTGATRACWYVTNLPRARWSIAAIAALYRLRWAVERLWRRNKHLARLDHLDSGRLTVLYTFIAASLTFQVLADGLAHTLEGTYGPGHVSPDNVLATLLHGWLDLARWLRAPRGLDHAAADAFFRVLAHEGRHPNPSQPRRLTTVFRVLETLPGPQAQAA
jgi:putative transposase